MQQAPSTSQISPRHSAPAVPQVPPALPDPAWRWLNMLGMAAALVLMIAALFVAIRSPQLHVRLCAISGLVFGYVGFVWLCCLLARARGYHPAWGLAGTTLLGGLVIPFLPVEDDQSPLVRRGPRLAYWVGLPHVVSLLVIWGFLLGAFWNSFESGWVLDNLYIIKLDPRTRSEIWESGPNPIIEPGVIEYFRQDYWWPKGISGLYRPLTSLTYWLNWTVFGGGEDPTGMHVVNLVIHWVNAALVYTLAVLLTRRWAVGLVAALIFGVHPITTESVTNIIGRADQFAALAVLGGLLVWRWGASLRRWWTIAAFILVMLITAFGVFSKESAIAIGLVILTYDLIYRWHPVLAKWFAVLVGLGLVPLISGGIFAIQHPWWEPMGSTLRAVIAAVTVVAGLGTHVFLVSSMGGGRFGSIVFSLVFAVIASAFIPAAGVALFGLIVLYELLAGPWWAQHVPEFERIKWPAVLYTAGFCVFVFLPLAFGAVIWLKAGHAVKHTDAYHALVGPLNALGGSWPLELPAGGALGVIERLLRAGMLVSVGVFIWIYFTVSRRLVRAAAVVLVALLPFLAAAPLLRPHTFELDLKNYSYKPQSVHLIGSFNDWSPVATPMTDPDGDDVYRARLRLPSGVHQYKFLINGDQRVNDPRSQRELEEMDREGGTNSAVRIGWPDLWWHIRLGMVAVAVALVLALLPQRQGRPRPWLALPVVLLAALAATLYVFWAGFALMFTVGLIELVRRSLAPGVLRNSVLWHELIRRFVVGYYLLLPPVIMMVFVRYWIFNIQSTPPETPFLDNPLRGGPFDPLPFWQSRMTAIKVMGKLIYLLFWPVHLSSDYSWDQIPFFLDSRASFVLENTKAGIALLFIVGLIILAVWSYRRNHKALSFFIFFFFAAILPTSNLPTLIGSIMAERFMYLPLIGFAGAVAIGLVALYDAAARWVQRKRLPFPGFARAAVAGLAMAIVFTLFSYRAYIRNFDWRTDITLWEAAMKISPRSFRCYQSLAFAYYEQDAQGNIDKMIATAEQARPIVDPLPHDRNSSRLYLHLGMYYNIKGDSLSQSDGRGGLIVSPEAQAWYRKSVDVLERGVLVDRTFNEVNRRKQLERGDRPDNIYDSGLSPVYMTLGLSYQRLGMGREAINAFNYMRQLEPQNPEPYFRIAMAYLDQQKFDEAAVAIIQCILIDPKRKDLIPLLAQIYSLAGPGARGTILESSEGPKLNLDHPLVRDHFISAYRSFIRIFRYANRPQLAEHARQMAVYRYRMPPSLFDSLMIEPVPKVTPHGIEYASASAQSRRGG